MLSAYEDLAAKDLAETQTLLCRAESLVRQYCKGFFAKGHNIAAEDISGALLRHVTARPGIGYMATAIIACEEYKEPQRPDFLATLAGVWLIQLLLPLKEAGTKKVYLRPEEKTPTQDKTATLLERSGEGDLKAHRFILRYRQGERCPLSGAYTDDASPEIMEEEICSPLRTTRFLPVSSNEFNKGSPTVSQLAFCLLSHWLYFKESGTRFAHLEHALRVGIP
ncbi:hypothetical protein CPB83DRAFT_241123 [Crepidotus variabilis]|uniref:Uncharacterized protein n=1 Tax=Crepidotus variabilis TaxID=179855 RepID=A0A9P6EJ42_9AGAR|nr:hypothetical protein CPB83DRAFT_241123 [Crepidotus variabilis]